MVPNPSLPGAYLTARGATQLETGSFSDTFNFAEGIGGRLSGVRAIAASYTGLVNIGPVPEPQTYALMRVGLGMLGFVARRRHPP